MRIFVKKYLLILFILTTAIIGCKKDSLDIDGNNTSPKIKIAVDISNSSIPYIIVNTKNNAINNEPKIQAEMEIIEKGAASKNYQIGIEYRGKTSFRLSDKKPYGFETWDEKGNEKSVSLLGMPEETDWILNNHVVNLKDRYIWDRTLMYNFIGYELARSAGVYASRLKFVELQINSEYQGVYLLMEKLKRSKNRININALTPTSSNITGGYILKIDKAPTPPDAVGKPLSYFLNNWADDARYTSQNSFRSRYDINGKLINFAPYGPPYHPNLYLETYFNYEYPEADQITNAQKDYIQKYIDQFETALANDDFTKNQRTYDQFIDLNSFVDYFIFNELFRNVDGYRLSTYLQKDRDSKLKMGPIWDLNIGFDEGTRIPKNEWVINYNKVVKNDPWMMPFWWPKLLEDPVFRNAVKTRWTILRKNELSTPTMMTLVDNTATYLKNNGAVARNYNKWDIGIGVNYDASINNLKNFLSERASWMDGMISKF